MQILAAVIMFLLSWFIIAFVIMLAAKMIAGMEATFMKSLIASLVGAIASVVLWWLFETFLIAFWWAAGIVVFIVWLMIIKYYFGTGWIGALIIAILAFIIYLLLAWLLSLIGVFLPL